MFLQVHNQMQRMESQTKELEYKTERVSHLFIPYALPSFLVSIE